MLKTVIIAIVLLPRLAIPATTAAGGWMASGSHWVFGLRQGTKSRSLKSCGHPRL
jgi:hypothetical protein